MKIPTFIPSFFMKIFNRINYYRLKFIDIFLSEEISSTLTPKMFIDNESFTIKDFISNNADHIILKYGKDKIIEKIKKCSQEYLQETIKAANLIYDHEIDLFEKKHSTGISINWHKDVVSGREWPLKFYADINIINLSDDSDVKYPWELNRFYHAVVLGKAYWFTGNEKYSDEFVNQIKCWIKDNPVNKGINWNCSMEVGVRVVNLIWAYFFFIESKHLSEEFHNLFINMIIAHGRHIFRNLENKSLIRGNHYVANLIALLYISTEFPIFKNSKKWKLFAIKELINEMDIQVNEDGTNFENSIPYHRLVTEMFFHAAVSLTINQSHSNQDMKAVSFKSISEKIFGQSYIERLEKMCEFTLSYTKPDGLAPQIGDNDNGRFVKLGSLSNNINDHRHILAVAGEFFDRDDFRYAGRECCEEAIWLFGGHIKRPEKENMQIDSKGYPDAGIYIMRKDSDYLIVRCGELGTAGKGTHTHNDNLGFELCAGGITYLIDPGTYTYSRDVKMRNLFRSTRYHNTLVIDGEEQNDLSQTDLFLLHKKSQTRVLAWEQREDEDIFMGENLLTLKSGRKVTHRRKIRFNKVHRNWEVSDFVQGDDTHELVWNFHGNIGILIELEDNRAMFKKDKGKILNMVIKGLKNCTKEVLKGWYSPSYGIKTRASMLKIVMKTNLPFEGSFFFYIN